MNVRWMFHATAMVGDYDAAVESLERLFGLRILHCNVSEEAGIGRRGGMTWVGDGSVEIGEPAGPDSPVRKFVERSGGGMHSIAVQVDDTEAAKAHFADLGVSVATEPYAGMVWTRPADTAGVLIEWYSLEEPTDPRWGARVPDGPPPLVTVSRLAFVTAMVRDPTRDGERLGEILRTPSTRGSDSVDADSVEMVLPLGDCSLALVALGDARTSLASWGIAYDRPRVHGVGLLVDDVDAALEVLADSGIGIHRRTDAFVVLDPLALPLPVMLCDHLLRGDPRS